MQVLKRYLVIIVIGLIGSLVPTQLVLAQQDELSFEKAVKGGQVTAVIRGVATDGSFTEPMLQLILTNEISDPVTIIIPQGLTLGSDEAHADLVILKSERVMLQPAPATTSVELFAYSLEFNKGFPDNRSEYQLESLDITPELGTILDNIINLGAENELASQIAVWQVHHGLGFEELQAATGSDFSTLRNRVSEVYSGSTDSSQSLLFGSILVVVLTTGGVGVFWLWRRRNRNWLDNLAPQEWEKLSNGGMAEIWKVKHPDQSDQHALVKFPLNKDDLEDDLRSTINLRFSREIHTHRQLDHENIVPLLAAGECRHPISRKKTKYIALQFINGCTIKRLVVHQKRDLHEAVVIYIFDRVLAALEHVHREKVVHRDISWRNVMLDREGRVYLIDFGYAAKIPLSDREKSQTEELDLRRFVSHFFAPPSDIGRSSSARDLYALAVLIYGLYGGQVYENNKNPDECRKIIIKELPNMKRISDNLTTILRRCLRGEYKDATSVRSDLKSTRYELSNSIKEVEESFTSPI